MKHKYFIDSHKGLTGPYILALIAWYHAWDNVLAWIYFGLHGTYGLLWVLKSRYFGDKNWERDVGIGMGIATWVGLSLYWISPWLIVSGRANPIPAWLVGVCIAHWAPLAGMGLIVATVWVPNMRRKDKSLSRYPEFAAYKSNTKLIIPYLV